jgi:hypothetical protein
VPSKYTRNILLVALPGYKIIFSFFLENCGVWNFGLQTSLSLSLCVYIYGLWMIHGIIQRISLSAIGGKVLKS